MPISDSDRIAAVQLIGQAQAKLATQKGKADADLYEMLRNLLNAVKILSGDQSPLVE